MKNTYLNVSTHRYSFFLVVCRREISVRFLKTDLAVRLNGNNLTEAGVMAVLDAGMSVYIYIYVGRGRGKFFRSNDHFILDCPKNWQLAKMYF